jgi:hypothetical protein
MVDKIYQNMKPQKLLEGFGGIKEVMIRLGGKTYLYIFIHPYITLYIGILVHLGRPIPET